MARGVTPELFTEEYAQRLRRRRRWHALPVPEGELYAWDADSTYIHEPALLRGHDAASRQPLTRHRGARVLVMLGDSVTTDHISPAG